MVEQVIAETYGAPTLGWGPRLPAAPWFRVLGPSLFPDVGITYRLRMHLGQTRTTAYRAGMSRPLLILNAATLSPAAVAAHAPYLKQLAAEGSLRPLKTTFPALSCSSHASILTGQPPSVHGIVGNGWYERQHAKIFMWNRSSHLIEAETIWDAARKREPGFRCANLFWRMCADSTCNTIVTERPSYWASGAKVFDFFASPAGLHAELKASLGDFPFHQFWGPLAGEKSTRWILAAAERVMARDAPDLMLVYAPYIDYDAERYGADSPQAAECLRRFDRLAAVLIEAARAAGRDVAVVSDYGWDVAEHPIYINRVLRRAGLLNVELAQNGERLEPGTSRAFAVVDNQIAHVYVADRNDLARVRATLEELDGVAEVLDDAGKARMGIDHRRAGDLVAVAQPRYWFAYPYWLDDSLQPDFTHCIAIFDKIGWDPTELFYRRGLTGGALRFAVRSLQKLLKQAVPFDVIAADERLVGGTRNARNHDPDRGALLLTSWALPEGQMAMEQVKDLMLARMFNLQTQSALNVQPSVAQSLLS
jgi:predicted AlkP superfamily pyrophosphatase or phosphodiesterase